MFTLFFCFLGTLRSCFQTRAALHLEILALRHQINVLRRSLRGRVRLTEVDRLCGQALHHMVQGRLQRGSARPIWPGPRSPFVRGARYGGSRRGHTGRRGMGQFQLFPVLPYPPLQESARREIELSVKSCFPIGDDTGVERLRSTLPYAL